MSVRIIGSALVLAFCTFMLGLTVGQGRADEGMTVLGPVLGSVFALNMLLDSLAEMRREVRA